MEVTTQPFGQLPSGKQITKYVITYGNGLQLEVMDFGATVTALKVPSSNGPLNVVLGYDSLEYYLKDQPYLGATVGPFANRIRGGIFELEGKIFPLETNNGNNHLHGGKAGLSWKVWNAEIANDKLVFRCQSPDGEGNFPGNLDVTVTFQLDESGSLQIDYEATTDKKTIINLTNHSYFNLSEDFSKSIVDHELLIPCERFIPTDTEGIPLASGPISVANTALDFRQWRRIGDRIDAVDQFIKNAGGYDHCWVKTEGVTEEPTLIASARSTGSEIQMDVFTTEPGVQFFSGNYEAEFEDGSLNPFPPRTGFCLETQHYPDSPNRPEFPTTILEPNSTFRSTTIYRFGAISD